jgi:hypothetical protein
VNRSHADRRKSLRLSDFDYGTANAYFVTACAQGRAALFGRVADGLVAVSAAGEIVQAVWEGLPIHYANIGLDEFVVMPNHIHGIIWNLASESVGAGLRMRTIPTRPYTEGQTSWPAGDHARSQDFLGAPNQRTTEIARPARLATVVLRPHHTQRR